MEFSVGVHYFIPFFLFPSTFFLQMTALHWSAYNNTPENVRLLLKAVSTLVFLPSSPHDHQCFCQQGADIVVTDVDGKTALHWTANNPDDRTVKTILVRMLCILHC